MPFPSVCRGTRYPARGSAMRSHPLLTIWLSGRSSARRCSTCSGATTPGARASASSRSARGRRADGRQRSDRLGPDRLRRPPPHPVGLVRASANLTASTLSAASLTARRRGVPGPAGCSAWRAARRSRWVASSAVTSRSRAESVSTRRPSTRGPATGRRSTPGSWRTADRPAASQATRPFCSCGTRASARAERWLLAPQTRARRRSGRGRVGDLPLPRLPLQPSRRFDRTARRRRRGNPWATRARATVRSRSGSPRLRRARRATRQE